MSYGWNTTRHLPYLPSYKEADKYEAKVVPIRRDKNGTKPLGQRNKKWMSIRREGPNEDIVLRLGGTEYLRYSKNNNITFTPYYSYGGAGINQLVSEVLGVRVKVYGGKTWVMCATKEFASGYVPVRGATIFKNRGRSLGFTGGLFLSKPVFPVVRTINRKKANEERRRYKSFIKQALGTLKLLNEPQVRVENQYSHGGFYYQTPKQKAFHQLAAQYLPLISEDKDYCGRPQVNFGEGGWQREAKPLDEILALALSEEQDAVLKAALYFTGQALRNSYNEAPNLMAAFKRMFDKAFIIANPHLLQKTIIKTGKLVKDRYGFVA